MDQSLRVRGARALVGPTVFPEKLSTALSTDRARLWIVRSDQTGRPPLVKSDRTCPCTPQQKIFAKVKAAIWPLTCGFIYCDTPHIVKTGNRLNFLPYI